MSTVRVARDLFFWLPSISTLPGPKTCSKPSVLSKFSALEKCSRPLRGREHVSGTENLLRTEGLEHFFGPGRVEMLVNQKNTSRTTINLVRINSGYRCGASRARDRSHSPSNPSGGCSYRLAKEPFKRRFAIGPANPGLARKSFVSLCFSLSSVAALRAAKPPNAQISNPPICQAMRTDDDE